MEPPRRHSPLRLLLGRTAFLIAHPPGTDSDPHFVRDYRRLVRRLKADYPLDEAMSLAVGGAYVEMGGRLADMMAAAGLVDGRRLLDLGCGSGRLATALAQRLDIEYTGIDIIPELLAYSRSKSPSTYNFILHRNLNIPVADATFDFLSAFSVFTHLRHEETYCYLSEAQRVLRPGGTLVFSFLEFADETQWDVFAGTLGSLRAKRRGHANVFIERSVLELWAARLGFAPPVFWGACEPGPAANLGQSVAILKRPAEA